MCGQEECRGWDVNEVVFGPAMWPTYHSLMRADFTLFDEYKFQRAGEALGECCLSCLPDSRASTVLPKADMHTRLPHELCMLCLR